MFPPPAGPLLPLRHTAAHIPSSAFFEQFLLCLGPGRFMPFSALLTFLAGVPSTIGRAIFGQFAFHRLVPRFSTYMCLPTEFKGVSSTHILLRLPFVISIFWPSPEPYTPKITFLCAFLKILNGPGDGKMEITSPGPYLANFKQ